MRATANRHQERRTRQELIDWMRRLPGCFIAEAERDAMAEILPDLFGYHLVQVGELTVADLTQSSRIAHRVTLRVTTSEHEEGLAESGCTAITNTASLPLATASVDVVLLPHVLEYAESPHAVLREVERILIGDGHLVIISFNPISLFGLWRVLLGWRRRAPWVGHYFSGGRIKDWLTLLGFEIVSRRRSYFRPPCRGSELNDRLSFLDYLGARLWPYFGAINIIVARKCVIPLTAARAQRRGRVRLVTAGLAEPSSSVGVERRDERPGSGRDRIELAAD